MVKSSAINNQRHLHRQKLIFYLKLVDTKTNLELARLGDINMGGVMLLNSFPLPSSTIYHVLLELPKTFQKNDPTKKHLPLHFETVWTRPGPANATYYETGARFVAPLNEEQIRIIKQLTDIFAMP